MRPITVLILAMILAVVQTALVYQYKRLQQKDTVVIFEGKRYSAHVLIGVGRTHKNRVPIYTVGFVPEESIKDAF